MTMECERPKKPRYPTLVECGILIALIFAAMIAWVWLFGGLLESRSKSGVTFVALGGGLWIPR